MIDLLFIPSTLLYLLVVGLLFIFGANFLYLTAIALRKRNPQVPPSSSIILAGSYHTATDLQ